MTLEWLKSPDSLGLKSPDSYNELRNESLPFRAQLFLWLLCHNKNSYAFFIPSIGAFSNVHNFIYILFENGLNYICDAEDESRIVQSLPFNPLEEPSLFREEDGVQFSHSLTEQLGGLLKAGFIITDLYEDTNGYGLFDELNIPSFIAVRAVKKPSVLSDLKNSQA